MVAGGWGLALAIALPTRITATSQQPAQLPDAPGRAVVEKICTNCHGPEILLVERNTAAWRESIELMKSFGAVATDEEWTTIHAYFLSNLATLNVNRGTAEDFADLRLVAREGAERIVAHREMSGPFKTLDDLKKAPGIDTARVDAIAARLSF